MTVLLEIRDGPAPWYMSPDIQVVAVDDPEREVDPIAGTPCLLRAIVRNNGDQPVTDAITRFYWSDPTVGMDRNTAVLVGSAFASIAAGGADTALCLVPWVPAFANNGHECLFAEAYHPGLDPLPPGPVFDTVGDRHVAQRNISVLQVPSPPFHYPFQVVNPWPVIRTFEIRATQAPIALLKNRGSFAERNRIPDDEGRADGLAFALSLYPDDQARAQARPNIDRLELPSWGRTGFSLVGRVDGPAALVLIEQLADGVTVGGLGVFIVVAPPKRRRDRTKE